VQLFVDMDGVLADFDTHYEATFGIRSSTLEDNVDWDRVRAVKGFYLDIPPMADMAMLWERIERHRPIVLTGVPKEIEEAAGNKRAWVARHLGDHVEVRCCRSREKCLHAAPGDVLIDDWEKYKSLWLDAGGVWITHRSAAETADELSRLGL
jgi:hypothetical protein